MKNVNDYAIRGKVKKWQEFSVGSCQLAKLSFQLSKFVSVNFNNLRIPITANCQLLTANWILLHLK